MAWWIAKKGAPWEYLGATEVNEEAAKRGAAAKSKAERGTVFQVRYRVNANALPEVRWQAVDGNVTPVTGEAQRRP
jgi:hypothetical protein